MEQYYYNHMDKQKQAAYHGILQGITSLADEFQIPALDGEDLYNVFFQLRLDHPEIFWADGISNTVIIKIHRTLFLSRNICLIKGKIKEHQKAMKARVEKLVRPAHEAFRSGKKKSMYMILSVRMYIMISLKKAYSHEIIGPLGQGVGVCEGIAKAVKVLLRCVG